MNPHRNIKSSTPINRVSSVPGTSTGKSKSSQNRSTPRNSMASNNSRLNMTANTTVRSNNTTLSRESSQKAEDEWTCEILYNEYLQTALRNKIVKDTIKRHSEVLNGQLLFQKDTLMSLEANYRKILDEIDDLQKQNDVVEMFKILEKNIKELNRLFKKYEVHKNLDRLNEKYVAESKTLILQDVKPIGNQEELDVLDSGIKNSLVLTEKILEIARDNAECHELAESLREHTMLMSKARDQLEMMHKMEDDLTFEQLKQCSDYLARR